MTEYEYSPIGVMKDAISLASLALEPGVRFCYLIDFTGSVQGLNMPSSFFTNRHGEAQLEEHGSEMLFSNIYWTSASNC